MEWKKKVNKVDERETNLNQYKLAISALRELIKDTYFVKQRKTLEEVQKTIENANETERKLTAKCQRLESEIVTKIKAAIQLSDEDKNTIDTLKEELEKAWKMADELRLLQDTNRNVSKQYFGEEQSSSNDLSQSNELCEKLQRELADFKKAEKIWNSEKESIFKELDSQINKSQSIKVEKEQLEQDTKCMTLLLKEKNEKIEQLESIFKSRDGLEKNNETKDNQDLTMVEIENSRLQIFELEEALARKDKHIEELVKENRCKTGRLEEMEQNKSELKIYKNSSSENRTNSENTLTDKDNRKCLYKKHKNLDKQLKNMASKGVFIAAQLNQLKNTVNQKTNLILEVQCENKMLISKLTEKTDMCTTLSMRCDSLREVVDKSTITIRELENIRDKYVYKNGNLEAKILDLRKELFKHEHSKYPETIVSLKNDLFVLKEEIENLSKYKNLWEETSEEKFEIEQFITKMKRLAKEAMQEIDSVKRNIAETNSSMDSVTRGGNEKYGFIEILFNQLKKKIEELVEYCKELRLEKYKLYDEVGRLKTVSHSAPNVFCSPPDTKETTSTEIEQKQRENKSLNKLEDDLYDADNEILTGAYSDSAEDEEAETEKITETASFEYETYVSILSKESLTPDLQEKRKHFPLEYQDALSEKDDFSTNTITREEQKCAVNLLCEKQPKSPVRNQRSSDLKGNGKHLPPENQVTVTYKVDNPPTNTIPGEEQKSRVNLFFESSKSPERIQINESLEIQSPEDNSFSFQRKMLQRSSKTEVFRPHDLKKYRSQLRMEQKKLDAMSIELERHGSNFSIRNEIYQKSYARRKQTTLSLKKPLNVEKF